MANTPSVPASDTGSRVVPREFLAKARELTDLVFRFADISHPAVGMLYEMGVTRRAEMLAASDPTTMREDAFLSRSPTQAPERRPARAIDPDSIAVADMALPSPPQVYVELQKALAHERTTSQDLADIVGRDTALTAKLLKLVNSAYFGRPIKVETLSRALTIIGTRELGVISSGIAMMANFKDIPQALIDVQSFWRHSLATGCLGQALAEAARIPESERFFVAGLLHDLGRLILFQSVPDIITKAMIAAREEQALLYYKEQDLIGYDHSTLGAIMLRKWNIPAELRGMVLYHHNPDMADNLAQAATIHVADIMARGLGLGLSGEFFVPPLNEMAWDALQLAPGDLRQVAVRARERLDPLLQAVA